MELSPMVELSMQVKKMRRNRPLHVALAILIVLPLLFTGLVYSQPPLPIGDEGYRQANPFDSNPTTGAYDGVGTPTGTIGNTYDGDPEGTNIAFYYGWTASGYVEISAFHKPSDYGYTDFTITWIDIKISYKAASIPANDDRYRIVAYVDPSPTEVVLQDWATGLDAKYDPGLGQQAIRTFSNVSEPNDGTWYWSDLAGLRVRFETQQVGMNNWQRVTLYEVWVTAYSTLYPAPNTMSVQPSAVTDLHAGDLFFIDLYVTNVTSMWGYQISLNFTPSVLTALHYFSYGPFISANPSEIGPDYVAVSYYTYYSDKVGFTGNTPICRIYFTVNADGTSVLDLTRAMAANATAYAIELTARDGLFASNPVHDMAVTDITVNATNVLPGESIEIGATVMNQGTYIETSGVSVFYDSIPIATETVTDLLPGMSQDLSFVWDTSGVTVGFHQIKGEATTAVDDTPANNVKVWDLVPEGLLVGRHDIAVTQIVRAYSNGTIVPDGETLEVLRGEKVIINATVSNLGDFSETFNVTALWRGAYYIENKTDVSVDAGTSETLTFEWNTDVTYPPWEFGWVTKPGKLPQPKNESSGSIRVVAAPGWSDCKVDESKTGVPYEKGLDYDYTANNFKETVGDVQVNRDVRYPMARFLVNKSERFVGEPATFYVADSWTPPGTTIVKYRWDFGDGNVTEGNYPTIMHVYTSPGEYSVNLTVTNNLGLSYSIKSGMEGAPLGKIEVTERNIKIVSVTASPTTVAVGQNVTINVTIKNDGARDEWLYILEKNVTVYYDDVMIGKVRAPNLGDWNSATNQSTVALNWTTSGMSPGTYTVKAMLDVMPYENDTEDNALTDGIVTLFSWDYVFEDGARGTTLKINTEHEFFKFMTPKKDYGIKHDPNMAVREHMIIIRFADAEIKLRSITIDTRIVLCVARAEDRQTGETYWLLQRPRHWIVGDVNYDGVVDIYDTGVISAHWHPGPPLGPLGYDPNADINSDGAVDMLDAAIVSAHWGQTTQTP